MATDWICVLSFFRMSSALPHTWPPDSWKSTTNRWATHMRLVGLNRLWHWLSALLQSETKHLCKYVLTLSLTNNYRSTFVQHLARCWGIVHMLLCVWCIFLIIHSSVILLLFSAAFPPRGWWWGDELHSAAVCKSHWWGERENKCTKNTIFALSFWLCCCTDRNDLMWLQTVIICEMERK